MSKDFSEFEHEIGYTFKNRSLLLEAYTHRSYLNEVKGRSTSHNERLEFLGDAVLELIITDFLYKKYPTRTEGELTSYRAGLVNSIILATVAGNLNMGDYLLLSKGEAKDTGKARQYILANAIEALIGAIYLDSGYAGAEIFVRKYIFPHIDEIVEKRLWQDAKSAFQEHAQEEVGITPLYKVVEETGPDHQKQFRVGVYLGVNLVAEGVGQSKQEAEQEAAAKALEKNKWKKQ